MSYRTTILAETDLVSLWTLDETSGTDAVDAAGANDGTYTDGFTLGADSFDPSTGTAVALDGTDGCVLVPHDASLDLTTAVTLEFWCYRTVHDTNWHGIVNKRDAAGFAYGCNYQNDTFQVYANGTIRQIFYRLPLNAWCYVVISIDATEVQLYINGVPFGDPAAGLTLASTTKPVALGASYAGSEFFPGRLDEVAIYGAALDAATVLAHHLEARPPGNLPPRPAFSLSDDTGLAADLIIDLDFSDADAPRNRVDGVSSVIQGSTFSRIPDPYGDYGFSSDSPAEASRIEVQHAEVNRRGPWTIQTLVTFRSFHSGVSGLWGVPGVGGDAAMMLGGVTGFGAQLRAGFNDENIISQSQVFGGRPMLITWTFDGTTYKLYFDAALDNTATPTTANITDGVFDESRVFNSNADQGTPDGVMHSFRLWARVLDADEVAAIAADPWSIARPSYTLSGPTTGTEGVPIEYTVTLEDGITEGTITITPDDGGAGGTFNPETIELTSENPSDTFTYTPPETGEFTITVTNDASLADPEPITLTASVVTARRGRVTPLRGGSL